MRRAGLNELFARLWNCRKWGRNLHSNIVYGAHRISFEFQTKQETAMKTIQKSADKSINRTPRWPILLGTILTIGVSFVAKARAENGDAEKLLKGMADYVASQKTITVTFDSDIEVITSNLQKIQFTSSGQVQLSRPDKLRATRTGGYRDVEIVFDGKMLTVNNKDGKDYAQIEAAGTAEELIDVLREKHGVVAPGADLLLTNVFNVMMADVVEAAVIGKGVIDGVECDHLAFRNVETDWQIWIESGAKPIPRKYVITSKGIGEAPQYTLRIKEWKTDVPADAFAFKPDPSAKKIALGELGDIDEVPQGTTNSRRQRNDPHIDTLIPSLDRRPSSAAQPCSGTVNCPLDPHSSLVSSAEARIGRPLTPMSYAGVARRTTRRAVAVGARGSRCGWSLLCSPGNAPHVRKWSMLTGGSLRSAR